ncbi:nucleotidyltransferase [Aurantimonas sp. NFXS3]|uniref:nucleotidyltransferase n=1 Tax=Aurantimonas sp. NFXS3 TaxID=2818434 RepID=UPI003B8B9C66
MSIDQYLSDILTREAVDTGPFSPALAVREAIEPIVGEWAGQFLISFEPSGSFAKGTANGSSTDIDLFISLASNVNETLKEVYESLFDRFQVKGYAPRRQNVSIGVTVQGIDVDLVPGKLQNVFSDDHSLYRRKADTWTKTNVREHVRVVSGSAHRDVMRLMKLWRDQRGFDVPSFLLELTVIEALRNDLFSNLERRVVMTLEHVRARFQTARVVDPANGANIVSDDVDEGTKLHVARTAEALLGPNGKWLDFVR